MDLTGGEVSKVLKFFMVMITLLIGLCVLLFVLENDQAVALNFIGWVLPTLPVSILILVALVGGLLAGACIGWFAGRTRSGKSVVS